MLKATVIVKYKEGVDDPEGKTIRHTLHLLGFKEVADVRVAKYYEIILNGDEAVVDEIIKKLLVNPVIHEYEVRVERL